MIEKFTKIWFANLHQMREQFTLNHPENYKEIVTRVVQVLHDSSDDYRKPDPENITEITGEDYQGTNLYIIKSTGWPSKFWTVKVDYGSCSGCDTLEWISERPRDTQVTEYMQLALHIVQELKEA